MLLNKDNEAAHGSSSMIMENALIIDECFCVFGSEANGCISIECALVVLRQSPALQFGFRAQVSSKLKVTFHLSCDLLEGKDRKETRMPRRQTKIMQNPFVTDKKHFH